MALIRNAQLALAANDPAGALALVDEHARRFPAGVLVEEREVERVLALCGVGRRSAAQAAAERFVVEHPRSMHLARVREACPEEER